MFIDSLKNRQKAYVLTHNISTIEETWFVRIVRVQTRYILVARLFLKLVYVNTRNYSGVDQSAAGVEVQLNKLPGLLPSFLNIIYF